MGLDRLKIRTKKGLDLEEMRSLCPIANPSVQTEGHEDGSILIVAPLDQQGRGMAAVLARWMKLPATKKFELEPVGAFVWSLCDGTNTVGAIGKKLQERYKMNRIESEAALTAFLRMLGQRRLISLTPRKRKQ